MRLQVIQTMSYTVLDGNIYCKPTTFIKSMLFCKGPAIEKGDNTKCKLLRIK